MIFCWLKKLQYFWCPNNIFWCLLLDETVCPTVCHQITKYWSKIYWGGLLNESLNITRKTLFEAGILITVPIGSTVLLYFRQCFASCFKFRMLVQNVDVMWQYHEVIWCGLTKQKKHIFITKRTSFKQLQPLPVVDISFTHSCTPPKFNMGPPSLGFCFSNLLMFKWTSR